MAFVKNNWVLILVIVALIAGGIWAANNVAAVKNIVGPKG
jgi:hypothetical protein